MVGGPAQVTRELVRNMESRALTQAFSLRTPVINGPKAEKFCPGTALGAGFSSSRPEVKHRPESARTSSKQVSLIGRASGFWDAHMLYMFSGGCVSESVNSGTSAHSGG